MWTMFLKSLLNLLQYFFCFCVLVPWLQGMWDPSYLTRVQTHTLCTGRRSLKPWTSTEVPSEGFLNITKVPEIICLSCIKNNISKCLFPKVFFCIDMQVTEKWKFEVHKSLFYEQAFCQFKYLKCPSFSSCYQKYIYYFSSICWRSFQFKLLSYPR